MRLRGAAAVRSGPDDFGLKAGISTEPMALQMRLGRDELEAMKAHLPI
jgi:hypothetical protein